MKQRSNRPNFKAVNYFFSSEKIHKKYNFSDNFPTLNNQEFQRKRDPPFTNTSLYIKITLFQK